MQDILIIDDDDLVRQSLSLLLSREGFVVHSAAGGREALELARQQAFTVVVCDIRMPDMDGIEAVRLLRQELEDAHFIMITGYASEEAPIQALRLGVDDYLRKPFDLNEFLERIRTVCRERRLRRAADPYRELFRLAEYLRSSLPSWAERSDAAEKLCREVGESLGLKDRELAAVCLAAHYHQLAWPDRAERTAVPGTTEPSEGLERLAQLLALLGLPSIPNDEAGQLLVGAVELVHGTSLETLNLPAGILDSLRGVHERWAAQTSEAVSPARPARLQIVTLGRIRVLVEGVEVSDAEWESARARWLFLYLLSRRGQRIPQERLMEVFWPNSSPERARRALISTVHRARKAVSIPDAILRGDRSYSFNRDLDYWWDVDEVMGAIRRGRAHEVSGKVSEAVQEYRRVDALYRGEFARECLDDWAVELRDQVCRSVVSSFETLAALLLSDDPAAAERQAWRALALEPTAERAYALLIRSLILQGRRDEAVRVYQQCVRVLEEELDLMPGPEVAQAVAAIGGSPERQPAPR
ncbi:MAG: response regulator [Armatimonadetes bacterium]|nr:response regulator [Armatimonadota bacterium]